MKSLVDFINEEQLNESILGSAGIIAAGLILSTATGVAAGELLKKLWNDGSSYYDQIPSLKDTIKNIMKDKKMQKIANKYKDDVEIMELAKHPGAPGWQKLLSDKLDPEDLKYVKQLGRKYFNK